MLLSTADVRAAENVCMRLMEVFPVEPPALLHGDLWAGNFMPVQSQHNNVLNSMPSVFDPAVYFGHREMDLGMTLLFGGFDAEFYNAYNNIYPLEKNWRERVSLTQLYPLLVHAILFGGSYVSRCRNILKDWS